jgi:hypothetical protein
MHGAGRSPGWRGWRVARWAMYAYTTAARRESWPAGLGQGRLLWGATCTCAPSWRVRAHLRAKRCWRMRCTTWLSSRASQPAKCRCSDRPLRMQRIPTARLASEGRRQRRGALCLLCSVPSRQRPPGCPVPRRAPKRLNRPLSKPRWAGSRGSPSRRHPTLNRWPSGYTA